MPKEMNLFRNNTCPTVKVSRIFLRLKTCGLSFISKIWCFSFKGSILLNIFQLQEAWAASIPTGIFPPGYENSLPPKGSGWVSCPATSYNWIPQWRKTEHYSNHTLPKKKRVDFFFFFGPSRKAWRKKRNKQYTDEQESGGKVKKN